MLKILVTVVLSLALRAWALMLLCALVHAAGLSAVPRIGFIGSVGIVAAGSLVFGKRAT